MTQSWWSGEPGENFLDGAVLEDEEIDAHPDIDEHASDSALAKVPWWIFVLVIAVVAAFVGAAVWLVYYAASDCHKSTVGCFQPNR